MFQNGPKQMFQNGPKHPMSWQQYIRGVTCRWVHVGMTLIGGTKFGNLGIFAITTCTRHASFTPLWHTAGKISGVLEPCPPFYPCDVTNTMKSSEIFENHLVVPQCIYHVNFTSPWPFVLKMPSLSDSEHRPVHLWGVPVWRHSWNTKSLITF